MLWSHSGRMHWTNNDIPGVLLDVRVTKDESQFIVIDDSTGEILDAQVYSHPSQAMAAGSILFEKAVANARKTQ